MNAELIRAVRSWAVVIFGCVAIAWGMIDGDAELIMLGFATLGAEPMGRAGRVAANGSA